MCESEPLTLYVVYTAKSGCREAFVRQIVMEGIADTIRREEVRKQTGNLWYVCQRLHGWQGRDREPSGTYHRTFLLRDHHKQRW